MSLIHRMSEPVRTPVRRFTNHYAIFFEDLIHAVKNEIVDRVDNVDRRVESSDRSLTAAYEAISDQLAVQTATLRSLGREVERLQQLVSSHDVFGTSAGQDAANDGEGVLDLAATPDQAPTAPTRQNAQKGSEAASGEGSARSTIG